MTTTSFGRRIAAPGAPPRLAAAPAPAADDARFEALRRELASERGRQVSGFQAWRKETELGRWLAWVATFALLTPGVICFMAHAPAAVSSVLEVGGIVGGFLLRRARRQRLSAIRDWAPDDFA